MRPRTKSPLYDPFHTGQLRTYSGSQVYIHQRADWTHWTFDEKAILPLLAQTRYDQGAFLGRMKSLGFDQRQLAQLNAITDEVLQTSAIEGVTLPPDTVRSSIARRLGIEMGMVPPQDRDVEGVVYMMLDASEKAELPLTDERLFGWHGALFPTGWSDHGRIRVGDWRDDADGPMQVVSGFLERRKVHYEAPAAIRVPGEMERFLDWHNHTPGKMDPVLRSALAHFWFVSIHPFDDGNGRIARAIGDAALALADESPRRYYSLSAQIYREKKEYYDVLEASQRAPSCDLTLWYDWFLNCMRRAIRDAEGTTRFVLFQKEFWESVAHLEFTNRHREILRRLSEGFVGHFTTKKWATIAKISHDTANRDIKYLIETGLLTEVGAGRSTHYRLNISNVPGDARNIPAHLLSRVEDGIAQDHAVANASPLTAGGFAKGKLIDQRKL